jgi:zinc protease
MAELSDEFSEKKQPPNPENLDETVAIDSISSAVGLPSRYELLGELGHGGMGIVYKARDRETSEILALKILKPEIAANSQFLERFKNELRLAHRITHRNIGRLYEFHRAGDVVYLSMEYVEGENLRALLRRTGKLGLDRGLQIARQLGAGLVEAHRQSIVHRDLKPENIMLDAAGEVKVMDFGISRSYAGNETATGVIVGTPAYMAPEQAEGTPSDHRTDIYAFGLILYEMLTGTPAFTGETAVALALKQIRDRPTPPGVLAPELPGNIQQAIIKCLEKAPVDRFQSMEDLLRELSGESKLEASKPAPRGWLIGGVTAIAIVVVASALWFWWRARPSDSVRFPLEQFALANGLSVVLSADHASPTLTLMVAYRAGARSDQPGHSGLSHLMQFVMFESASPNMARGEFAGLVNGAGGTFNGSTDSDLAWFYETLPANQLDLALFLESDRLRGLEITQEGLNAAGAAVLGLRAGTLSKPLARSALRVPEMAFDNFVNQHSVRGTIEDLSAATVEDLNAYRGRYYTPSNAALALVGDFDPQQARERIRYYFESIPARPAPPPPDTREPERTGEKRESMNDPTVQTPAVMLAWRVPPITDPDWFILERITEILGSNNASRLQSALVSGAGVASSIGVSLDDSAGPNLLWVWLVIPPGKDPNQAEKLCYQEIEHLTREGVSREELERLKTDALRRRVFSLVTTFSRAYLFVRFLAAGQLNAVNEWERVEHRISSEDVRRVALKYFTASNRSVLIVTPNADAKRAGGKP